LYFLAGYPQFIRRDCSSLSVFSSDFWFLASRGLPFPMPNLRPGK
jgi:hypothetical protein